MCRRCGSGCGLRTMLDAAFWAGLGCVLGGLLPIVLGIVLLTWTTGELKVMFRRMVDRK